MPRNERWSTRQSCQQNVGEVSNLSRNVRELYHSDLKSRDHAFWFGLRSVVLREHTRGTRLRPGGGEPRQSTAAD